MPFQSPLRIRHRAVRWINFGLDRWIACISFVPVIAVALFMAHKAGAMYSSQQDQIKQAHDSIAEIKQSLEALSRLAEAGGFVQDHQFMRGLCIVDPRSGRVRSTLTAEGLILSDDRGMPRLILHADDNGHTVMRFINRDGQVVRRVCFDDEQFDDQ